MRLRDMVRFSEAKAKQENEPVTTHKPPTKDSIIMAVNANPGSSAKELTNHLGAYSEVMRARVSAKAYQLVTKKDKPQIKRVQLDGRYRYYPINYKLTSDNSSPNRLLESAIDLGEEIERHKSQGIRPGDLVTSDRVPDNTIYVANGTDKLVQYAVPQIERASFISKLEDEAKSYAWEHPESTETPKGFVNNCKEKNNE